MLAGQEQITPDALARRWRRARGWLTVTVGLHLLTLAVTGVLLPFGRVDAGSLVVVVAFAVVPVAGALWLERRQPSARTPASWPWRSLAVAFPQVIALGFAVDGVLDEDVLVPWQRILLAFAVTPIPALTAELARRALLRPLLPELGAGDVELLVEPRTDQRPWYYSDSITLAARELVISVRSGSGRATWNPKIERIALADVTAVGVRPALPGDNPWITLSDGRGLSVPPGDVVVVRCGDAQRVLPVRDVAAFAGMLRIRASRVRGAPVADQAFAPGIATGVRPTGHVPEVLPAPEASGAAAYPVAGPADPPRSGPGMAARWAFGFPLALLGIVGVPVGLMLAGGLFPAGPGLERYRSGFCVLWIVLAAAIWLRSWWRPRYWPAWALMSSLGTAIVVAVQGAGLPALLGPPIAVALTWAGRRMLIRPISTDLAGSGLEIPLRTGNVTVLVRRDRIVLRPGAGAGGAVPQALALGELTFAQPGQFAGTGTRWWPLPGARGTRLGRGPVLRLMCGSQQWLLPVDAPRELAAIIRARSATAARPDAPSSARPTMAPLTMAPLTMAPLTMAPLTMAPLTMSQWYELRSRAARQFTTPGHRNLRQRRLGFRLVVAIPAAFLGAALLGESIARGAGPNTGVPVVAVVALLIAAGFVADWVRVRRWLRVAEDNALPPGAPGWGELRPDHAPLAGWQPWWDAPRR